MKKFILCLLFTFISSPLFAATWCQWDGSEGTNCQSTSRTYITINNVRVTVSAANLNPRGWYELTVTEPTVGEDQVRDEVVWGFETNQISKTWTVRDMTAEEIDIRDAAVMPLIDYLQFNLMVAKGLVTKAEIATYLTAKYPELIDAYQARDRLENP